ncbi:MAG: hypothetical protein KJ626_13795, partial [Verrucomicrobia bacterium]|nr:hypothetical protein [Verrucomicrobiota bacterium]
MPVSGGASDKLGNRYEALWAIDQILQIVDGSALRLTLEPLDPDESRGIEFKVAKADGTTEYWSVKRQTTKAAGWTIALLASKDDHGRTILGDLLEHVKQNATHRSVFASTLGASTLTELCEYAVNPEILKQRLAKSVDLEAAFSKHVLLLCHDDKEQAVDFLQRVRTHAIDKAQLRDRVGFAIRKLFYAEDGRILDVDAVRLHLGDLLLDNIHQALDRKVVLSILGEHGFRLREWVIDEGVRDRVEEICEGYSEPVRSAMINDKFIPLNGVDSILKANGRPIAKKVLVVGGAGGGKSTTLVDVVEQMRRSGGPVLVVRFDQFPEGILSTRELGRKLFLPESPVLVLAGVANGAASVLVVDQLDAVSLASGRRTELWSLFEELSREAERFPNMSLIVGCREFDLKHDHRMRKMTTESAGYVRVKLRPFSIEQVDAALKDAAVDPAIVQPALKKNVLTLPLHLSMFLKLSHEDRTHVHNSDELFDSFWTEGERRTSKRLGRKAEWTKVIDQLANWLSENQLLSAPTYVLDDFSDDATSMASEHVIILSDDKYRFFHDSFFDYAFARRFACKGGRLVDLLLGDEQHLFRRAQVRQVLAFLRAKDLRRYLNELEIILTTDGVRFHIKAFVFQWLSSLPDPLQEEWVVLQGVFHASDRLWNHIRGVITVPPGWFDVLDKARFFDEALASGDAARESEAVS